MAILLDTNILCRLMLPEDPQRPLARQAVDTLLAAGEVLFITPQVEREFWVVATRPREDNGLGMTPSEADEKLRQCEQFCSFKPDHPGIHEVWRQIVVQHGVFGKAAHDAAHVAAMQAHGIERVLTFDAADFRRYEPSVTVWTPEDYLSEHHRTSGS